MGNRVLVQLAMYPASVNGSLPRQLMTRRNFLRTRTKYTNDGRGHHYAEYNEFCVAYTDA